MKQKTWACGWALVVLAGCGGDGLRLAPVAGVVTFEGQPVADAGVLFSPESAAQGPPASGSTDAEGRFALMTNNRDGAPLGLHRVIISKADPFGDEVAAEELENPDLIRKMGLKVYKTKDLLPPRYSDLNDSGLSAMVKDEENFFEFPLEP